MQLLVTNDDGIDAPGLAALEEIARGLGRVMVLAPVDAHSGCSHRVTTDRPLSLHDKGAGRFAVAGTPADCVRIALHDVLREPTWVFAGINEGGNLGADVHHSGTVAAVREAVLHGRPGIAISHYHKRGLPIDWQRAVRWTTPIIDDLLTRQLVPGGFWNINLPHLQPGSPDPDVVFCPMDTTPLPLSFRRDGELWHYDGDYHNRPRTLGSDIDVCFGGNIAVTQIRLF